jgi:hypothetical protein
MRDAQVRIEAVGDGGWVLAVTDDVEALVQFREAPDGRLVPGAVLIHAPTAEGRRPVSGADLREFPLYAVEAIANGELRERITNRLYLTMNLVFEGSGTGPTRQAGGSEAETPGTADLSLEVPDTRPYPDGFYASVARRYIDALMFGGTPAKLIAEANDIPLNTVHRWVGEARKRGHLPPGRKGKAG